MKTFNELCKLVLPTVYSDELSYSELLYKIVYKIQELSKSNDEIKELVNNFLNEYDTNLQNAVNNTLNEWKESGYFDDIVNSFLNTIFINVLYPPYDLEPLKNDGVTDNSNNLNAIINYLKTNELYGRIYFPVGQYLFNSTINVTQRWIDFEGEQESGSQLIINGNMTLFNVSSTDYTMNFVSFRRLSVSTNTPTQNGIFLSASNVFHLYVDYVRCYNMQKHIVLNNCSTSVIRNTVIQNDTALTLNNIRGIELINNCNSFYLNNVDITFRNVELGNNCIGILSNTQPNDFTIDRLGISGSDEQIHIEQGTSQIPGNIKITNCDFDGASIAIQMINLRTTTNINNNSGCIISNNYFGTAANNTGDIVIINNCRNIKLIGNTFTNFLTANIDFVYLLNSYSCALIGNSFINSYTNVIRIQSCVSTIISCNIFDCLNNIVGTAITDAGCAKSVITNNTFNGKITNAINSTATSTKCLIANNSSNPDSGYTGSYVNSSTDGLLINNIS